MGVRITSIELVIVRSEGVDCLNNSGGDGWVARALSVGGESPELAWLNFNQGLFAGTGSAPRRSAIHDVHQLTMSLIGPILVLIGCSLRLVSQDMIFDCRGYTNNK